RELLPLETALEIGQQICAGVGFAHGKGIVHRDLKPSNLMLTSQGLLKVMDFGIAKLGDAGLTQAGMILGTPRYLSPEQASGGRVDHRADIFAIGAILYELLTGEKAFTGETATAVVYQVLNVGPIPPKAIAHTLPPALDAVLLRALAKYPHQRFQSCEQLADALAKLSPGHSTAKIRTQRMPALQDEETEVLPAQTSGNRRFALWATTAVLVLAVAGVVGWQKFGPSSPPPAAVASPRSEPAPGLPAVKAPPVADPVKEATGTSKAPAGEKAAAVTPASVTVTESRTRRVAPPPEKPKEDTGSGAGRPAADEPSGPRGAGMFSAEDVPNLLARAHAYAGRGEYDKAIALYQEILNIQPSHAEARQGLQRAREARRAGR
ncbi:MAG: protein kinase domain-containing protein, partial [Terriglobales bacterium]